MRSGTHQRSAMPSSGSAGVRIGPAASGRPSRLTSAAASGDDLSRPVSPGHGSTDPTDAPVADTPSAAASGDDTPRPVSPGHGSTDPTDTPVADTPGADTPDDDPLVDGASPVAGPW